jgi:hypothetical protein
MLKKSDKNVPRISQCSVCSQSGFTKKPILFVSCVKKKKIDAKILALIEIFVCLFYTRTQKMSGFHENWRAHLRYRRSCAKF